jgi:hypothetical protein
MKVKVKLAQGKHYICNVKATSQLEAAVKGQFYGLIPFFKFKTI